MKKIILLIFMAVIVAISYIFYPFICFIGKLSIGYLEEIIFPTKKFTLLDVNANIDFKDKICIPYKNIIGKYSVTIEEENKEPSFFAGKELLDNFDFYILIHNDKNELIFYDTPKEIRGKSIITYNSAMLNRHSLPKAGCYCIQVIGIKKTPNAYDKLHFKIHITQQFG